MEYFRKKAEAQNALIFSKNMHIYFFLILFLQILSIVYWNSIIYNQSHLPMITGQMAFSLKVEILR